MSAAGTDNTADSKELFAFRGFNGTVVITVDGKTSGVSAGTSESVELQVCDKIIIKIWRKGIVFFNI